MAQIFSLTFQRKSVQFYSSDSQSLQHIKGNRRSGSVINGKLLDNILSLSHQFDSINFNYIAKENNLPAFILAQKAAQGQKDTDREYFKVFYDI